MKYQTCQSALPSEANFCHHSGQALSSKSQQTASKAILDAERKPVTSLFSGLSGYTTLTEKLDPEEVKEIASHIFAGIREGGSKYGGSC